MSEKGFSTGGTFCFFFAFALKKSFLCQEAAGEAASTAVAALCRWAPVCFTESVTVVKAGVHGHLSVCLTFTSLHLSVSLLSLHSPPERVLIAERGVDLWSRSEVMSCQRDGAAASVGAGRGSVLPGFAVWLSSCHQQLSGSAI